MTEVIIQHQSLETFDSPMQHNHDARTIFGHAADIGAWAVTGTEAGKREYQTTLETMASRFGFEPHFHGGEWVALNRDKLHRFKRGYDGPWIPGTHGLTVRQGGHSPRGCTWMSGEAVNGDLGRLSFGAQHWLTQRALDLLHSKSGNLPMVLGSTEWGRVHGSGTGVAFLCADTNESDAQSDVFKGKPFTTLSDELGKHPATHGRNTNHGTRIDIIASWNPDGRVTGTAYKVLDDSDLKLFGDHFVLVGKYAVKPIR